MKKADKDKWRFKVNESVENTGYKVKEQLGRGAIAEAYLVARGREDFVLKISALKNLAAGLDHSIAGINTSLQGEAAIMRALASVQAVPKLYDGESSVLSDDLFYIVTEYVTPEYQNLVNLCQQNPSEEDLFPLIEEILKFFVDLHVLGYEYCDVKPDHFYWNPQNPARPLLVIDYNLSRKRQKPSGDSVRLRWVLSDLRRLGQVLFRSLLMGQEIVPELPGASRPIPFEGDTLYDLFLPTSFRNDQSGHPRLDWFLRRLHAGKYGTAQEALEEFQQLISGEFDLETMSQTDRDYVGNQVSYWSNTQPNWDEIENCWGRLGEVHLSSSDELKESDELAASVYLWGVAVAYHEKSKRIGQLLMDGLLRNAKINQRDLQTDEVLFLFDEWHTAIIDPGSKKKRAWENTLRSFTDGYEKALLAFEYYFNAYKQDGGNFNNWQAYIEQCKLSLEIWTYSDLRDQPYHTLDKQCFSHLNPETEDEFLKQVVNLYKEHIAVREAICENLLSAKLNRKDVENRLAELHDIQDKIFENIEKLLLPKKSISIWPDNRTIKSGIDKVIELLDKDGSIKNWEERFSKEADEFLKLMDLASNEVILKHKDLFISTRRATSLQKDLKEIKVKNEESLRSALTAQEKLQDISSQINKIEIDLVNEKSVNESLRREVRQLWINYELTKDNLKLSIDILDKLISREEIDSGGFTKWKIKIEERWMKIKKVKVKLPFWRMKNNN